MFSPSSIYLIQNPQDKGCTKSLLETWDIIGFAPKNLVWITRVWKMWDSLTGTFFKSEWKEKRFPETCTVKHCWFRQVFFASLTISHFRTSLHATARPQVLMNRKLANWNFPSAAPPPSQPLPPPPYLFTPRSTWRITWILSVSFIFYFVKFVSGVVCNKGATDAVVFQSYRAAYLKIISAQWRPRRGSFAGYNPLLEISKGKNWKWKQRKNMTKV